MNFPMPLTTKMR